MAYISPTPSQLRARYPAFSAVSDDVVAEWIADAETVADAGWLEARRPVAVMAHAAHRMAETGLGAGSIPVGVTQFKSGTFSATIADGVANLTGYRSTVYGREFLRLRRILFAGPRVVSA